MALKQMVAPFDSLCFWQVMVDVDELIGLESPLLGFADKSSLYAEQE